MSIYLYAGGNSPLEVGGNVGSLRRLRRLLYSAVLSFLGIDFDTPVTAFNFSSTFATDEWLLQETSGVYTNAKGTETLANSGGLQGQEAIGLWDGSSYTARKAWESTGGDSATASSNVALDFDEVDFCFRVVYRVGKPYVGASDTIAHKLGTKGWRVRFASATDVQVQLYDGSTFFNATITTPDPYDVGWHYLTFFWNSTTDTLYVKTDDTSEVSADTSSRVSGFTDTTSFTLGGSVSEDGLQVCYVGGCVGANAQSMYNDSFWSHASSPAPLLTTISRSSSVAYTVAPSKVAHFSKDTVPVVYSAPLTTGNKLGLLVNSVQTNNVLYSENLDHAYWVKGGGVSVGVNAKDAPNGCRTAVTVGKTSGTQFSSVYADTALLTAGTVQTLSVWCMDISGSPPWIEVLNHDDNTLFAARRVTGLVADTWNQVTLPFVTSASGNAKYRVRLRPSDGALAETASSAYWGVEVKENAALSAFVPGVYVRTIGAPTTIGKSDYAAPGMLVGSTLGEITSAAVMDKTQQSYLYYPTNAASTNNFINQFATTTGIGVAPQAEWFDSTGTSEGAPTHPSDLVAGDEYTTRVLYDSVDGVGGYESVIYLNGIRHNGESFPLEGSISELTSDQCYIGSDGTSFYMDGVIQSISAHSKTKSLTVDAIQVNIPGVDIWTGKETIDFSLVDVGDLGIWERESFTVGWERALSNCNKNGNVYELTSTTSGTGGEISTVSSSYLYGSYRCSLKTTAEYGNVGAFFFFSSDTEEIDIEILSRENSESIMHCVVHENIGDTHKYVPLGFDPSAAFHEYRFDFYADKVEFYVDGAKRTQITDQVPTTPGSIIANHWSSTDVGWADGLPLADSVMQIQYIKSYSNIASHVSSTSVNTLTTSTTLTKPAGTVEGNVMVAFIGSERTSGDVTVVPTGWTLLNHEQLEVDGDGTGPAVATLHLRSYIKVAGVSEPSSYTWTRGAGGASIGHLGTYLGDTIQPDANGGTVTTASGVAHTQATMSTVTDHSDIVYAWLYRRVDDSDYLPLNAPTGMTERLNSTASPSNWGLGMSVYDQRILDAGAVGTRTMNAQVAVGGVGVRIAIKGE